MPLSRRLHTVFQFRPNYSVGGEAEALDRRIALDRVYRRGAAV